MSSKLFMGRFHVLLPGFAEPLVIPNLVTDQGEESFLKMIWRADVAEVASGGNWYLGLCEEVPGEADTLVSITTEPTSAGGYARQPFTRDATGVPTIEQISDAYRALSAQVTFTATGADFSRTFQRLFVTNVLSGTAGRLFAYSGPLPDPVQILDGQSFVARYESYLR